MVIPASSWVNWRTEGASAKAAVAVPLLGITVESSSTDRATGSPVYPTKLIMR